MDRDGRLDVSAGVPPDAFSSEGQAWGNPLYNWEKLKKNGYEVGFGDFARIGVPFTLTAVLVGYLFIWFVWR